MKKILLLLLFGGFTANAQTASNPRMMAKPGEEVTLGLPRQSR